jgi:hypothetical protein
LLYRLSYLGALVKGAYKELLCSCPVMHRSGNGVAIRRETLVRRRPTACCSRLLLTPKPTKGMGSLDFAPATRAVYNFPEIWAAGLEGYADYDRLGHVEPLSRQLPTLFAVADYKGEALSANSASVTASRRVSMR